MNHIKYDKIQDSDGETIPELSHPESSSDDSSENETEDELENIFEVEEPTINNVTTKFCELCDGSTDHETWECPKVDNFNIPEAERR